jgi:hypothetical protein
MSTDERTIAAMDICRKNMALPIDHDRVMMAIASNQGGCSVFEIWAEDIKPGMSIDLDGQWGKVLEVETTNRNTHLLTDIGRYTISGLFNAWCQPGKTATMPCSDE